MKKLTYLLAFFAILYSTKPFFGQSTIFVRAPSYYKSIPSSLPIELFIQPYTNGCYLITAPELAGLTGSDITSFAIHLFVANSPASGNISVYFQNTSDVNYSKGGNFPSCISGMSNVYTGPTTIAAANGSTDVTCAFGSPFNYTGGGLYVAFSWTAGVSSTPMFIYSYGSEATSFGVIKGQTSLTSAINSMSTTAYRPTFVFGLTNTATNEAGVEELLAPGNVAEALHASHVVQASIRNKSINALTNVPVTLNVSGANSFSDIKVISSLAPGAATLISFFPYKPTVLGSSTMAVSVPADDYLGNNALNWTQNVSCTQAGHGPPGISYYEPVAFQGILAGKFNFSEAGTMGTVRLAISSTGINDVVHGVLLDNNGVVIARTNTITVASGMPGTFQTFSFTPPRILQANTNYYIGMGIPNPNLSTMGCVRYVDGPPGNKFGILPLAGGTFSVGRPAYYGIEPVLSGTVNISPNSSTICKGESRVLIPGGASTYFWTNSSGTNVPMLADGSLAVMLQNDESYTVKGTDVAGCNGQATISLKVYDCTGLTETNARDGASLYPNPAVNGKTSIHGLDGINTIEVFNMLGQTVLKITSDKETVNLNMVNHPAGNYLVKITDANNHSKNMKFVHQE